MLKERWRVRVLKNKDRDEEEGPVLKKQIKT
jgi:hypothetical protein